MAESFEPHYRFSGRTPLYEAVAQWQQRPRIAEMLLAAGANPRLTDDNGWTLLHEAAKMGSDYAIDELLKLGLNPNAVSKQGFTPLHLAMRSGFGAPIVPCIKKLLAGGADPNIKNKQGLSPEELLRWDAARLLSTMNLAPETNENLPLMRTILKSYNDGLQALRSGAEPIVFPKTALPVEGWQTYPPVPDVDIGRIERKVKIEDGRTRLSLIYLPKVSGPIEINVDDLSLNAFEPTTKMPFTLTAGKEALIDFPKNAGPLGGAVHFTYSYKFKNGSGSGDVGESSLIPNPAFTYRETPDGMTYFILWEEISRPLEFRVDRLITGGEELTGYRGKVIIVQPSSAEIDYKKGLLSGGTPLVTVKKTKNSNSKLTLDYSYRLLGNKKWTTQNIEL